MNKEPWAKLISLATPKTRENPRAKRAYTLPMARPLSTWLRNSTIHSPLIAAASKGGPLLRPGNAPGTDRPGPRRDGERSMDVRRSRSVENLELTVADDEPRHRLAHVTPLVKLDEAAGSAVRREIVQLVPDGLAGEGTPFIEDVADRLGDDGDAVVGDGRELVRLIIPAGTVFAHERLDHRIGVPGEEVGGHVNAFHRVAAQSDELRVAQRRVGHHGNVQARLLRLLGEHRGVRVKESDVNGI